MNQIVWKPNFEKVPVFVGSFDPFHIGHKELVDIVIKKYGHITILVAYNEAKQHKIASIQDRANLIKEIYKDDLNVFVSTLMPNELTTDWLSRKGPSFLVRGFRNDKDMEYENWLKEQYQKTMPDIEIEYFKTSLGQISSSRFWNSEKLDETLVDKSSIPLLKKYFLE